MLDDFFVRALLAGIAVAFIAGPLGCFIVWRRMAYFGDTIAHSALLGVAAGLALNLDTTLAVFIVAAVVALALLFLERRTHLAGDVILGILSHSTLALALVLIALLNGINVDLLAYLLGDILAVSKDDILVMSGAGAVSLAGLAMIWRPLLADTADTELARAEGLRPERARAVYMLLLAGVIALAMNIVGILLITALLIIPAATARRFAAGPEHMALIAAGLGAVCVAGGLFGSLALDTPSGPSIVAAAFAVFAGSLALASIQDRKNH